MSHVDPSTQAAIAAAQLAADLGLPVPRGTRLRFLKRVMARLGRLVIHHQIAYNHALLVSLEDAHQRIGTYATAAERHQRTLHAAETRIGNEIGAVRLDLHEIHQAALGAEIEAARATEQFVDLSAALEELRDHLARVEDTVEELHHELDAVRRQDRSQHSLVELFLRQMRRQYPAPSPQQLAALPSGNDDLYEALEDTFRGSFEEVSERQRVYLADIQALGQVGPVLDLGCGRGEWLQLLRDAGIEAQGVDVNPVAVERCHQRGLEVVHADALQHLATVPDASRAVVTAFHIVEHIPFEALVELLDQAARVLQPGGILILETPNPTNILVGSGTFFLDPTHNQPLHPALLEFLCSTRGLDQVEVRLLHPATDALEPSQHSEAARKTIEPVVERLNTLLFGAQDYAVLSRRASR